MLPTRPWRSEPQAIFWTDRLNELASCCGLDTQAVLHSAHWCLLWDRQICMELVGDAQDQLEFATLQTRLLNAESPGKTPFWEHPTLVAQTIERYESLHRLPVDPQNHTRISLSKLLLEIIKHETHQCLSDAKELGRDPFLCQSARLADPESLFRTLDGKKIDSNTQTNYWGHWFPGLSDNDRKISDAIAALPGAIDVDIPEVIQRLENPSSPVALPGAVTLGRHDVLHILLGRGLLDQDEAFVIGFTMGNATRYRDDDGVLMRKALAHWYPEPFRISGSKLQVFDLGIQAGKAMGIPDIAQIPIENLGGWTLGHARQELKISIDLLRNFYCQEKQTIRASLESGRLPNCPPQATTSARRDCS
ncbi:MAG: hypothetical protein NTV29_17755 [Planctomycetota bacterium]|nr:hypothetical protein [Planctomycetota bacterium]